MTTLDNLRAAAREHYELRQLHARLADAEALLREVQGG